MGTKIAGKVALVTGANRGIGRALTDSLLERGASKVYAAARNPDSLAALKEQHGHRLVPLQLDVTDAAQVTSAAAATGDLQLLINNAGVALGQRITAESIVDQARGEMEVNYLAPLRLVQQLAPTLARNGGGAVVNILSVSGLTNFPLFPTYSASKAAAHSLTQAARTLFAAQGTSVHGVYPGPVDTDMAADLPMAKATPAEVAGSILDGIEAGRDEIFPDSFAVEFGAQFEASPRESERQVAAMVKEALGG